MNEEQPKKETNKYDAQIAWANIVLWLGDFGFYQLEDVQQFSFGANKKE